MGEACLAKTAILQPARPIDAGGEIHYSFDHEACKAVIRALRIAHFGCVFRIINMFFFDEMVAELG
jgi:hypothetical protein